MTITADGSGTGKGSSGTNTATISTTLTNDILVAVIACNTGSALTVTSTSGFHWTQLDILSDNSLEIWWALAPSALTNEVLTVTSAPAEFTAIALTAFNGVNTSLPWNTGVALNKAIGHPTDPISGTTTVGNTMLIGAHRLAGSTGSPTAGSGWTGVTDVNLFLISEYQSQSLVGTYSSTLGTGAGDANGSMIAALVAAGSGAITVITTTQSWPSLGRVVEAVGAD